jgi:hypothetical protein
MRARLIDIQQEPCPGQSQYHPVYPNVSQGIWPSAPLRRLFHEAAEQHRELHYYGPDKFGVQAHAMFFAPNGLWIEVHYSDDGEAWLSLSVRSYGLSPKPTHHEPIQLLRAGGILMMLEPRPHGSELVFRNAETRAVLPKETAPESAVEPA